MPKGHRYYVLAEEREQMQKETVKQAVIGIAGPVGFYERWPGEEPRLTITDEALRVYRSFCKLVWEDEAREDLCRLDYEKRAAACTEPQISTCWLGVHNVVCPLEDDHGANVTLLGGKFHVRERQAEAEEQLERFLKDIPPEQQEKFRQAWQQIPEISEAEIAHKLRELELIGRSYLHNLKQHSDFRYEADQATHDVVIALQALIADIEVLKIELQATFGIGKKWESRFEALIQRTEEHYAYLESSLLDRPRFEYESIAKLIYDCADAYLPAANARGIQIRVDLEQLVDEEGKHKVLAIRMDRVALARALRNVLDNAIKYSFSGTADHPRWVDIVARLKKEHETLGYLIVVKNLGIGIEKDEVELVFEAGYQGKLRLEEARSGRGMGLTLVKKCAENHGGYVNINSQPQQRTGWLTALSIWLPLHGPTERKSKEV